jgi:hypothetical protein
MRVSVVHKIFFIEVSDLFGRGSKPKKNMIFTVIQNNAV